MMETSNRLSRVAREGFQAFLAVQPNDVKPKVLRRATTVASPRLEGSRRAADENHSEAVPVNASSFGASIGNREPSVKGVESGPHRGEPK